MLDFMFAVSDRAGGGGYSTARIVADVLKRRGYYVHEQRSVHSNIKGLPTSFYFVVSDRPVCSLRDEIDVLLAFDQESLAEDILQMGSGGLLVCDTSGFSPTPKGRPVRLDELSGAIAGKHLRVVSMNMADAARSRFDNPIVRNTIALGMVAGVLGIEKQVFYEFIEKQYGSKAPQIVAANKTAFDLGYEKVCRENGNTPAIPKLTDPGRLFMLGDELIAFGAVAGGCRFFAGYPITPASEIFELMMARLKDFGGVAVQAPSELAAAGYVMGASYAGVRAMTATSGPGFDLMQEWISCAGSNEVPLVITLVQRGGPGTGLPTRTGQEDLNAALYGAHGEFPRIVLSPGTPQECFYFAALMFNLAERYQCPVILLSEQCVGQARYTLDDIDVGLITIDRGKTVLTEISREYNRYEITKDGISPRALPGLSGVPFMTSSNEHCPDGYADESITCRIAQTEKRMRKAEIMLGEGFLPAPEFYGDVHAKIGFIGYGGVHGPVLDAMTKLRDGGVAVKFLRLRTLMPLHAQAIRDFISSCSRVFFVEQNHRGQLKSLVQREVTGPMPRKFQLIRRYDGRSFRPRDIITGVDTGGGV